MLKVFTVAAWLLAAPVFAQSSLLPSVEVERAKYPTPMSEEQRGELLNTVAWQHRLEGWGLHKKDGGARCPQPQGVSISCDLLVHAPTQGVFDVLIDGEGAARPTWNLVGPINTMANFVAPTGLNVSPPFLPPPSLPPTDLTPLLDLMAGLERSIGILRVENHQDHEATRRQIAMLAQQVEGIILPPTTPADPAPTPPVVEPSYPWYMDVIRTLADPKVIAVYGPVIAAGVTWIMTHTPTPAAEAR